MKKTLVKKIAGPIVFVSALAMLGGCAPGRGLGDFMSYPFKTTAESIRYMRGGDMGNKGDSWAGTAIVKRDIYPDGTIVFIVDANKVKHNLTWEYTDAFIDATKYNKDVELLSKNIGLIKYIPR